VCKQCCDDVFVERRRRTGRFRSSGSRLPNVASRAQSPSAPSSSEVEIIAIEITE